MSGSVGVTQGAGEFLRLQINAAKLDNEIKAAVRRLLRENRVALVAALSRPGSGRLYGAGKVRSKRFFSGARSAGAYRASAHGQPPARRSGTLVNSVRTKTRGKNGYGGKVFAHRGIAFYRHYLEFGAGPAKEGKRQGAGGVRAPRPVFSPMQRDLDGKAEAAALKAVNDFVGYR